MNPAPRVDDPDTINGREVFHLTTCEVAHELVGVHCSGCNVALCGTDLTNVPWSDGEGEIPCPICFTVEAES